MARINKGRNSAPQGKVPVVLFIHKRSWHLRRVLKGICGYQPIRLFIFADGWAKGNQSEKAACQKARRLVEDEVKWPCRTSFQFSSKKMGLKPSVEKGLRYVFSKVPEAIILEDDCEAGPEFFAFCEKNLREYRQNPQVLSISGSCFVDNKVPILGRAYLSRYPHCWGWATWRRAWREYQGGMRTGTLLSILHRQAFPGLERAHWSRVASELAQGRISSWAYFWIWTHWRIGARALTPTVNLVRNIGFDSTARHTRELATPLAVRSGNRKQVLRGNVLSLKQSENLDRSVFRNHYQRMSGRRGCWEKIIDRWRRLFVTLRQAR